MTDALALHPDRSQGWLRRLWPVLRRYRFRLAVSMLAAALALGAQVLIPRVLGLAIDDALSARTAELWPFVAVLLALSVGRALLSFVYRDGLYGMAYRLEYDLRTLLFDHLLTLSASFYDRVQSGQIISRANSDIRSVQMFLAFAPIVTMQLLTFVLSVVFMLTIDPLLTLVACAILPPVFVVGQWLRSATFPLSWIVQARHAEVATVVDESVNGVRVVKSFAAEERQIDKLARAAERLRWANLQQVAARARYTPVMENLPRLGLAAVLLVGGLQAIDGRIGIGDLVSFNLYVLMLQGPFRFLGLLVMLGQRARASAARIYEILDERAQVVERPGAVDLVDPRGDIRFEDVSFRYAPDQPLVLDHLDLHIAAGERVAIVGRTGAGKSTVARLLQRHYDTTDGTVLIDDQPVRDLTLASVRAAVAVVPDEPFLFSTTVHDNIAYGLPGADLDTVRAAAMAAEADLFVAELDRGYHTVVGERGYDLSGGQRQRLAIARALVGDAPVVVFDDATSSIDVEVESRIHDALDRLSAGRTTVLIAHRRSTIALADRVLFLENGRVVASGTHAELLEREPGYAAVLADAEAAEPRGAPAANGSEPAP